MTNVTQTTLSGMVSSQFPQPTSLPSAQSAHKPYFLTQSSTSTSQRPQMQFQIGSQVAATGGSEASGRNPWISPDGEESDDDYSATLHSFDAESDDDEWEENSSDNGTDEEEPESLLFTQATVGSGTKRRRRSSVGFENDEASQFRDLVDSHLPGYIERAVSEFGGTPSQTQGQFQTQASQGESPFLSQASRASKTGDTLSSRQEEKRRQIVNAVLSLISHWMNIQLPKVRNVWKSLSREQRTFEELQKRCLQCDLSTTRKEYDATGIFTQSSTQPRIRKWGDNGGIARKRRKLTTFPSFSRCESSNTEADWEGEEEDEESELYFGGQNPDPPFGSYYDTADGGDDGNQEPPPILFRQTRLVPGNAKTLHPYPAKPDREWAKRICRVLAAWYGWRRASKVYEIWERFGGDAGKVEEVLKDRDSVHQGISQNLGLGDIPRPWS